MAREVVINSTFEGREGNKISLKIMQTMQSMINDKIKSDIEASLEKYFKQDSKLNLLFVNQLTTETPAQYREREAIEARDAFIKTLESDELSQTIKQSFNAVLLEHTVKKL